MRTKYAKHKRVISIPAGAIDPRHVGLRGQIDDHISIPAGAIDPSLQVVEPRRRALISIPAGAIDPRAPPARRGPPQKHFNTSRCD